MLSVIYFICKALYEIEPPHLRKNKLILKIRSLIIFAVLLASYSPTSIYGQITVKKLPNAIKTILDRDYPGWQFAEVAKEIYEFFKMEKVEFDPNFIMGDFDGNGKRDYAIQIVHGGKRIVLAFLKKGNFFKKYVLETSPEPNPDIYLWLLKKGEKDYDYEAEKEFFYPTDAIGVIYFEKAGVSYIFKKGKFQMIVTSD